MKKVKTRNIAYLIAQIDMMVASQLKEILEQQEFLVLRASWVGLHYLANQIERDSKIHLKVLDISWQILSSDLQKAPNIDQSFTFDKIHNHEFGIAGGEPFGLLIGDYDLDISSVSNRKSFQDIETLKAMAKVASLSFVPFICSVKATAFGYDTYSQLASQKNVGITLGGNNDISWQRFRENEAARYIGVVIPKVLLNSHYEKHVKQHREYFDPKENPIWVNAGYTYAAIYVRSFTESGWFIDTLGIPNQEATSKGGIIPGLQALGGQAPLEITGSHQILTETMMTTEHELEFNNAGFTTLNHIPGTSVAAFMAGPSLKKPQSIQLESKQDEQDLTHQVAYLLCACRFAHYLKTIGREKIGQYLNVKDCEHDLQKWLNNYIASNTDISTELKSRYPLTAGEVKIILQKGSYENYAIAMSLTPQLRISQISAGVQLNTSIMSLK